MCLVEVRMIIARVVVCGRQGFQVHEGLSGRCVVLLLSEDAEAVLGPFLSINYVLIELVKAAA